LEEKLLVFQQKNLKNGTKIKTKNKKKPTESGWLNF